MRGYPMYQAMKMKETKRPRCCTDMPVTRTRARSQWAPGAWTTKLSRALPGSLRVARAAFRQPGTVTVPSVGATVLALDGTKLGNVSEVFVSLDSGATALTIKPVDPQDDGRVIMLPTVDLEPGSQPDVFVARGSVRATNAA